MRRLHWTLVWLLLIAIATVAANFSTANKTHKHERIKVPIGSRKLFDILSDNTNTQRRRFEIEVDHNNNDDIPKNKLLVEEVHEMAINSQTTYNFHKDRNFNRNNINNIQLLVSNPQDNNGLTIMSINNGQVRGFHRGISGGSFHSITSHEDDGIHKLQMRRTLSEEYDKIAEKDWSCGAEDHHHHTHNHDHDSDIKQPVEDTYDHEHTTKSIRDISRTHDTTSAYIESTTKYSHHVNLSIDIDRYFIEKQGSLENAIEYINVLISAANIVLQHEVDTRLNIVSITEQTFYDELTTTKEALKAQRLHPRPELEGDGSDSSIILHHALLGRWLGGGIAFIDSICDKQWGYGVTSDLSGNLNDIGSLVLFDFFILTHELGHSLGSGHTFDGYDPPVDGCGACTVKPQSQGGNPEINRDSVTGLPRENSATIMSYCNFCDGGLDNIAITFGGVWNGQGSRGDIEQWINHPDIVGDVSKEPRRVSHNIWSKLDSKECTSPPFKPLITQGCNDDADCDDSNACTIEQCDLETNLCTLTKTLALCCGNGVCEKGESQTCSDCGTFEFDGPFCAENCQSLDGFMIDVGLDQKARRKVYINGIKLGYTLPKNTDGATIDVYVTSKISYIGSATGSYVGKEQLPDDWERITTVTAPQFNQKREEGVVEIKLQHSIPLDVDDRRGFYFVASEDIIKFREGVYSIQNDDGVELHSSLAVSGLFGVGINGFGLSVGVSYTLDDSLLETWSPTLSPTTYPPTSSPEKEGVAELDNMLEQMYKDTTETVGLPPAPPPPSPGKVEDMFEEKYEKKNVGSIRKSNRYIVLLCLTMYIRLILR